MAVRLEVVTETDEWLALEGEWNDLVDHSSGQSVFMRHEWLTAWWECFSRGWALRVLLVRGDGGMKFRLKVSRWFDVYRRWLR